VRSGIAVANLLALLIAPGFAQAQDAWRNTVTPYFMATTIEGDASLRDITADVDVPAAEVLDSLELGGMVRYRGESERFSINGELTYMKLSDDKSVPLGSSGDVAVEVENEMLIVQADVGFKFVSSGRGFAEVYLGVRYTDLTVEAQAVFPGVLGTRRTEGDDDFVDPVIGMRSDMPLSDRWTLKVQTDVGGFGAGMDVTWIAFGALEYRFSDGIGVWFGYQGLGQDFDDAGDRENLAMDVIYHGPVLGLALSW
jgi:hypothetical protein